MPLLLFLTFYRKASTSSVLLPKTSFPLRISSNRRKERDIWITKTASFESLYKWQRKSLHHEEEFILHDGPPYANGKSHMGHALNKILKDIILRYKLLSGNLVHYVPGWDCHGLPIELKAIETNNGTKNNALQIRERAKIFALDTIKCQKAAFSRWGVMADWENECYFTFSPTYVASQLQMFYDLHEKGLVYRDYKPVYWSPSSRTALAESELEYNMNHVSSSIYLKLALQAPLPECLTSYSIDTPIYLVVWTTTPWTIPANQAVCYNPNKKYCLVRCKSSFGNMCLLIALDLCSTLEKLWSCQFTVLTEFFGNALNGHFYAHPIRETELMPLIPGNHVTMKKGTGFVHTAPAHGPEDFLVALQHKLSVLNLVNEEGKYSADAGHNLSGLSVLHEGQEHVLKLLKKNIIFEENFTHSYPYDWRTKLPVILRASLQWFIDTDKIKNQAVNAMKDVTVIPANFEKPMLSQLSNRPYWCISRQRAWGVPIPVFYKSQSPTKEAIFNRDLVNRLCDIVLKEGIDQWWLRSPEDLIGKELMEQLDLVSGHVFKGMDIMDIWFDSGVSWNYVLPRGRQADLYLEGVDQFGGWFQSSLLTSVASTGRAPYKNIFVHGFVLDHQGRKMSKSQGNVIDPLTVIDGNGKDQSAVGIDALRWWIASHVTENGSSLSVSIHSLQQSAEDIQKIRSILRFLLGNLNGLTRAQLENIELDNLCLTDRYILHLLTEFVSTAMLAFKEMNFRKVTSLISFFLHNHVSAFYCSIVKDRLYCYSATSADRVSALFVLSEILDQITLIMAPILPHLTEEIEIYHPWHSEKGGLFRNRRYTEVKNFDSQNVIELMKPALSIRNEVNKAIGSLNTQEWCAQISVSNSQDLQLLKKLQSQESAHKSALCDLLQVSMVNLYYNQDEQVQPNFLGVNEDECVKAFEVNHFGVMKVILSKTHLAICPRCRRYTSSDGHLCSSCLNVVSS